MNPMRQNLLSIPGAIIVAGALVAMAIILTNKPAPAKSGAAAAPAVPNQLSNTPIPAVTATDHIFGNPNAPVKIVEYSDPSCPYCKMFNPTMTEIMSTYGAAGKVAWVYRHFPLDKADSSGHILHPNAGHEAEGLECAASLGGNTKFWAFEKEWYSVFPTDGADRSRDEDTSQLTQVARDVGIDARSFADCLSSGQWNEKIDAEYASGVNAGVTGTPTSFMITPLGNSLPLQGAVPYDTVKNTVETLLSSQSQ